MKITNVYCAFEPEKFINSYGFKGKTLSGVWQTSVVVESNDIYGLGLGVQSVLWSDGNVFSTYGENESNKMMFSVTEYAAKLISGKSFETPKNLIEEIFDECKEYSKQVTKMDVTDTFVLNALVPVDFALWQLWARANNACDFDKIYKGEDKNVKLANIPLITYGVPVQQVQQMAKDGVCIFKIKIGSDPEGDGDQQKMLAWDKARMLAIHNALKDTETPYTECGKAVYYFDANGRYESKELLKELVDYMVETGIADQTVLFEEPFAPEKEIYVGDLPIIFAADESAHSLKDVKHRIELGYKAITLKPIAKTLSVTIDMADYANQNGVQCFCADLTVNPVMVEWNKNFAARLKPLKGMKIGVVESNGAQNYIKWQEMKDRLPFKSNDNGNIYNLDEDFYNVSGGVFDAPEYYINYMKNYNNIEDFR